MAIIAVANVSKCFHLQPDRPRSFQELLVNTFKRSKRFASAETFWALKDVSFQVEPGEMLGIIGANGSGKSTCLKLLARIIEPTSGTVHTTGRVSALLELGAGFHPELTGRENIFLYSSVLGLRRREMMPRFDDIVAFAELERFIDIPVKFYSSGMYVRLAFAAATNVSPDVLLVDEVLAVGDQSFQTKCLERIQEMRARGITIVFVSHSLDTVRSLCQRAIWLEKGILREDGLTEAVAARYLERMHHKEEEAALARREAQSLEHRTSHSAATASTEKAGASAGTGAPPSSGSQPQAAPPALQPTEVDPIARARKRWGTREVEIVAVRLLDREGRERLLLSTGEPMTIVIRYLAHTRIASPAFGVAFHRNDGLNIHGSNTALAHFAIPFIEGKGEVRYTTDALPLLEGKYYLSVAVHNALETVMFDYHDFMYEFSVRMGPDSPRFGTIYIPARWEHQAEPAGDSKGAHHDPQAA